MVHGVVENHERPLVAWLGTQIVRQNSPECMLNEHTETASHGNLRKKNSFILT